MAEDELKCLQAMRTALEQRIDERSNELKTQLTELKTQVTRMDARLSRVENDVRGLTLLLTTIAGMVESLRDRLDAHIATS